MRLTRNSSPGRKRSVAVDWHDCVWSPRIAVKSRLGEAPDESSSSDLDAPIPACEDQPSPGYGATGAHPAKIITRMGLKPLPAPASHFTAFTLQFVHH